jgi:hypothetical protein
LIAPKTSATNAIAARPRDGAQSVIAAIAHAFGLTRCVSRSASMAHRRVGRATGAAGRRPPDDFPRGGGVPRIAAIRAEYAPLSDPYQDGKTKNDIPLN